MKRIAALALAALAATTTAYAGSIVDGKHNLSVSGPGPIKSSSEGEICIFCHTPHQARQDIPYLWNRADTTINYTTYQSSTLYASVGQPTGASKLCLSCHDGTIALGAVLSRSAEIPFAGGVRFLPTGSTRLGTDISDDHPVSFVFDDSVAIGKGEMVSPATLTGAVRLDAAGELQCTACHDPHDDANGKFLVMRNQSSALCTTCHQRSGWATSSHATSGATWNGSGSNPWPGSAYATVTENGCESCHRPHTAGGHERLLQFAVEEDNCLVCHTGSVASIDLGAELLKSTGHKVQVFAGVHDAAEDPGTMPAHVECTDCHNAHRVNPAGASPPLVTGRTSGVSGVSATGSNLAESLNLYEICFKCHADNSVTNATAFPRQYAQLNTRLELDPANPSYHPVEAPGRNADVPSLLPPYTTGSVIYCTACHNNDQGPGAGGAGPNGPHGSSHPFLLERSYATADNSSESASSYALCYKCHDRNNILNDRSFRKHKKHIQGERAPCSVCHDPHGVSATQGNTTNNSHLINFRTDIVTPNNKGRLEFVDQGRFRGQCSLTCHGKDHDRKSY